MLVRTIGLYIKYIFAKIKYRGKVRFNGFTVFYQFPDSLIDIDSGGNITINSHPLSNLVGLSQRMIIVARYGGKIKIGSGCGFSGSTIYAMDSIEIGKNVIIGGNCKIIDNDFHPIQAGKRIHQNPDDIKRAPIKIGDGCFIGTNAIILKGTTLGKNCVVGAGSVVCGFWPDNSVIAGNPAKNINYEKPSGR